MISAGNIGKELIRRLHLLTGANISASICFVDDTVPCVYLQLNYFVGEINSDLIILPSPWQINIIAGIDNKRG